MTYRRHYDTKTSVRHVHVHLTLCDVVGLSAHPVRHFAKKERVYRRWPCTCSNGVGWEAVEAGWADQGPRWSVLVTATRS